MQKLLSSAENWTPVSSGYKAPSNSIGDNLLPLLGGGGCGTVTLGAESGKSLQRNGWGNEKWQFSTSNRICNQNQPHFLFTQPFILSVCAILPQIHMYKQRRALRARPCAQCSCDGLQTNIGSRKHHKNC